MLYTLAEHVSIAPSSIAMVAAAVAGAVGAIHGIVKIIDARNGKNGKHAPTPTVYNCGLEPSISELRGAIDKLCAVTIERARLQDQRFDVLDKNLERVENALRSQA